MLQAAEVEETAVQKLWRAVIATTVEEWVNGPLRQKREAEQFLFDDNQDYQNRLLLRGNQPGKSASPSGKNSYQPDRRSASARFAQLISAGAEVVQFV